MSKVDWAAKIASARRASRTHDQLDCLSELERLLATVDSKHVDVSTIDTKHVDKESTNVDSNVDVDRRAYQREWARKKRAAKASADVS